MVGSCSHRRKLGYSLELLYEKMNTAGEYVLILSWAMHILFYTVTWISSKPI